MSFKNSYLKEQFKEFKEVKVNGEFLMIDTPKVMFHIRFKRHLVVFDGIFVTEPSKTAE
jgi:hypothetical protein